MSRRVIVTGGSRGIGRAAVERFAKVGDSVAFLYRAADAAADEVCSTTGAASIRADVGDAGECAAGIARATEILGGVDILVCSAGIAHINFLDATTDDMWSRLMSVNAGGVFTAIREAVPHMLRQKHGRIVTLSSIWGISGASMEAAYSATKAAVIGLTKAAALELAPSGITVNCVAPGVIDTEMNAALTESDRAALADEIPLGRFGTPAECAEAIFFLASDAASYITGQVLAVNGGFGS